MPSLANNASQAFLSNGEEMEPDSRSNTNVPVISALQSKCLLVFIEEKLEIIYNRSGNENPYRKGPEISFLNINGRNLPAEVRAIELTS